jgi:hypothetical protein
MSASLVQVIVTDEGRRGLGTENSPVRSITRYFSPEGLLLAEVDVWFQQQIAELRRVALNANGKNDQTTLAAVGMRLAQLDALTSGFGHAG